MEGKVDQTLASLSVTKRISNSYLLENIKKIINRGRQFRNIKFQLHCVTKVASVAGKYARCYLSAIMVQVKD